MTFSLDALARQLRDAEQSGQAIARCAIFSASTMPTPPMPSSA
ncbi:Uncharacterised protein [Serratia liquefaciens]|nr:Uncharacterised protein [Serratia liquefaciens]